MMRRARSPVEKPCHLHAASMIFYPIGYPRNLESLGHLGPVDQPGNLVIGLCIGLVEHTRDLHPLHFLFAVVDYPSQLYPFDLAEYLVADARHLYSRGIASYHIDRTGHLEITNIFLVNIK